MSTELAKRFYADDTDYRTAGVSGEARMMSVSRMKHSENITVRLSADDAPDLGLMLSPQQAQGLRDYLTSLYSADETADEGVIHA